MEPTPAQTDMASIPVKRYAVVSEHIGVRVGCRGGKPHLLGHRIKVEDVAIWYERLGMSASEIVDQYPTITLAQVHAALAYYYDHRDRIEADLREGDQFVSTLRAGILEKTRLPLS